MATKAQIDLFLSDPDYLALVGLEREHRLLFITDLSETRVSAFLGWLFRPHEGHGLGDQAFRELMLNVWRTNLREELGLNVKPPRELLESNFGDLLVHTEYRVQSDSKSGKGRPIDLLLVSRRNKLVVAIENKFGSAVHSDQLTEYRKGVAKAFPTYSHVLVYLDSSEENKPDDGAWIPLGYQWLIDLISTHQRAGLLSERALDALDQFKDYLTHDVAISSQSGVEKDSHIENIARKHEQVLDTFKEYRKVRRRGNLLEDPAVTILEPLLIEYHQRSWLWDDVLDQARHAAITQAAKKAFGDRIEVTSGPAEVRFRLKVWSRLEADPDTGQWGPRVVAWTGREGRSTYKVWAAVNFRHIRPELESDVRDAALNLRDVGMKRAPKAAQWMRLSVAENLDITKASERVVAELRRLEAVFAALHEE